MNGCQVYFTKLSNLELLHTWLPLWGSWLRSRLRGPTRRFVLVYYNTTTNGAVAAGGGPHPTQAFAWPTFPRRGKREKDSAMHSASYDSSNPITSME